MKLTRTIKVLGPGCKRCNAVAEIIKLATSEEGMEVNVEKVSDLQEMMKYNVISTPAVVLDEKVIFSGSVPTREEVLSWF